jgi:hypothetical protein
MSGHIGLWSIPSLASRSSQSLKETYAVLLKLASVVGEPPMCLCSMGWWAGDTVGRLGPR